MLRCTLLPPVNRGNLLPYGLAILVKISHDPPSSSLPNLSMHLSYLNPQAFYDAIIRGCQSLIRAREQLNTINIFPVADGDTGDNLSSTANAIIHYAHPKLSFNEMLNSVADASVLGARGNSGIIFSQFFNALANNASAKETISVLDFSTIMTRAAQLVRESIATPLNGTILTMIEAFAHIFQTYSNEKNCFTSITEKLLPKLKEALNATTEAIVVLKKANVVDAGALGFYFFIEGFTDFLSKSGAVFKTEEANLIGKIEDHTTPSDTPPVLRYCTEAILRGKSIDKAKLTALLTQHGDSLAFTGNDRVCRFHIHTNEPWHVFTSLRAEGSIEHPKVDDMQRQFEITHHRQHEIALVTDTCADISQTLKDKYQVHLIPTNVHLDNHALLDGYCLDPKIFYAELKGLKNYPKTSLPSPALIEEKLQYLSRHYKHVLVISVAKAVSGTYEAFTQTAQKYENITVIDSHTNSGAQGLLVNYAGELIEKGLSFEDITERLRKATEETSQWVMVDNLESMIRSGRINKIAGRIGQFSGLKPIVSIDKTGKGNYLTQAFNANNALTKIIDIAQQSLTNSKRELAEYCIIHAGTEEQAHVFAELTTKAFKKPPAYIEAVSAAIGLHAGQGCVALAIRSFVN